MTETKTADAAKKPADKPDPREARARPSIAQFAVLAGQLAVIAAFCWRVQPLFFAISAAALAAFTIHYWTPYRHKEPVWFFLSIAGGIYVAASPGGVASGTSYAAVGVAFAVTVALALFIWGVLGSALPYSARVLVVSALFAGLLWLGAYHRTPLGLPDAFFRIFGSVFMFHVFMYAYEAKRFKARPSLRDFFRYFFMLPSFRLTLPFVDTQRIVQSYYQREGHLIAQQGIFWIARGGVQYAIYTWATKTITFATNADSVRSPAMVLTHLFLAYCLYLRTSGLIHAFIGTMHLFGYDLPEGYRWYWLAHSPMDFWRRINIYWKDAMMKLAYMPTYFALRKKNDAGAKIAGMIAAFALSWILHIWRLAWLSGLKLSVWRVIVKYPTENAYWLIFGTVATVDLIVEIIAERRRAATLPVRRAPLGAKPPEPQGFARHVANAQRWLKGRIGLPAGMHPVRAVVQIGLMWLLASSLFSLQHAPSIYAWLHTMRFWN